MPFAQAAEEVWHAHQIKVEEATVRSVTHRHGKRAEAIEKREVARIAKEKPVSAENPKQLFVSVDGAYVALTNGEWKEVKTMVIGGFSQQLNKKGKVVVTSENLSYFGRSYRVREFEEGALAELHRRGVENASLVVTVNDGADWIQNFVDYHIPDAIRILDFCHALEYMAEAGKAIWGESDTFQQWFTRVSHQFKHKPPQETLAELDLLFAKANSDEQAALINRAYLYLKKRLDLIDYAHFRRKGFPIGSGSVESAHKLLFQSRMKQSGMRWAESHVDPMLALRSLICNGRWDSGWQQIVDDYWQQLFLSLKPVASTPPPAPPTFPDSVQPDPSLVLPVASLPDTDPPSHPWRSGWYPSYETRYSG